MLLRYYVISCAFVLVVCKRQPKLFSFNLENRDISVDLDFSIPFITIPIQKSVDSFGETGFPTINLNPAALALGGAIIIGTTILIPLLLKHYSNNQNYRDSKVLDNFGFSAEAMLNFANQMFVDGRGIRGCTLRVACWTAKQQYNDPTKIINIIANNKLISPFINTTAIQDAMLSGWNGRDCMSYSPCPIQEDHIPVLLNNLAMLSRLGKT